MQSDGQSAEVDWMELRLITAFNTDFVTARCAGRFRSGPPIWSTASWLAATATPTVFAPPPSKKAFITVLFLGIVPAKHRHFLFPLFIFLSATRSTCRVPRLVA